MIQMKRETDRIGQRRPVFAVHWKVTLVAMILTFTSVALVSWFHTRRQIEGDRRDAELLALESAHLQATRIKTELQNGLAATYSLKSGFLFALSQKYEGGFALHEHLTRIMIAATRELTPDFAGVYLAVRPGIVPAPEGRQDYETPDMARYYSKNGYFLPYYLIIDSSEVTYVPPAAMADGDTENETYFARARDTLKPYLHEPYRFYQHGKARWSGTGITLPIVRDGEFIGVAGVNLNLERILGIMAEKTDFSFGQGMAMLVSPGGAILPAPTSEMDSDLFHEPNIVFFTKSNYRTDVFYRFMEERVPDLAQALHDGRAFHDTIPLMNEGGEALIAGVPFRVDGGSEPWLYLVVVPTDIIDRQASITIWESVGMAMAAILVALLLSTLLGKHITYFLEAKRRWFETILDRLPTPLVIRGAETKEIQFINQAVEKRLGVENREVLIGHTIPLEDGEPTTEGDQGSAGIEFSKGGRYYRVHTSRLEDDTENTFAILEVATDVTEEKELAKVLAKVSDASEDMDSESGSIAAICDDVRDGVVRQAVEMNQISRAADGVEEMAEVNVESARRQSELSEKVCEKADALVATARENQNAMRDVMEAGQYIRELMRLLDEVAFQAKLLGINASVEAARAGRVGKSFGVVASEITELAARCAKGVRESSSVLAISMARATNAATLSEQTVSGLLDILGNAKSLKTYSEQVAESAKEQSDNINEVNASIRRVNEELQRTSKTVEQQAEVAENLKARSSELRNLAMCTVRHNLMQN